MWVCDAAGKQGGKLSVACGIGTFYFAKIMHNYLNVSWQAGPKVVVWDKLSPAGSPQPHDEHSTEEIGEAEDLKIMLIITTQICIEPETETD